jgi:hypothetical protein
MKKLLFRFIFGFSLGVTLLMLAYIGIYYIGGQEVFNSLIAKLADITIFQNQLLVVGSAGVMISFAVYLLERSLDEDGYTPSRMIVSLVLLLLSISISMFLIENLAVFDKTIVYTLIVSEVALFAIYTIFHCIQETIDEFIINKKIKEKNS